MGACSYHEELKGKDFVAWSGDNCDDVRIRAVFVSGRGAPGKSLLMKTSDSDECRQSVRRFAVGESSSEEAQQEGEMGSLACSASNYIHTSHTLQEFIRVDLAWLRSTAGRYWDCNQGWWSETEGHLFALSGSGPSWWLHDPPTFPWINWGCDPRHSGTCSDPVMFNAGAWFHTDFLHCNFINQDIYLETHVGTNRNGSRIVVFDQTGSCPGVFSATEDKVNGTNGGGYGGTGTKRVAKPHVSGT